MPAKSWAGLSAAKRGTQAFCAKITTAWHFPVCAGHSDIHPPGRPTRAFATCRRVNRRANLRGAANSGVAQQTRWACSKHAWASAVLGSRIVGACRLGPVMRVAEWRRRAEVNARAGVVPVTRTGNVRAEFVSDHVRPVGMCPRLALTVGSVCSLHDLWPFVGLGRIRLQSTPGLPPGLSPGG